MAVLRDRIAGPWTAAFECAMSRAREAVAAVSKRRLCSLFVGGASAPTLFQQRWRARSNPARESVGAEAPPTGSASVVEAVHVRRAAVLLFFVLERAAIADVLEFAEHRLVP